MRLFASPSSLRASRSFQNADGATRTAVLHLEPANNATLA